MARVIYEGGLPEWLRDALNKERELMKDSTLPKDIGCPGYVLYHLHPMSDWYAWDCGTGGVILTDGKRWLNYEDLDFHKSLTEGERRDLKQSIANEFKKT